MPSDVNITQHWNTTVIENSVFSFAALKFRLTLSSANRTLATDHYWYRSKNLRNTYNANAPPSRNDRSTVVRCMVCVRPDLLTRHVRHTNRHYLYYQSFIAATVY